MVADHINSSSALCAQVSKKKFVGVLRICEFEIQAYLNQKLYYCQEDPLKIKLKPRYLCFRVVSVLQNKSHNTIINGVLIMGVFCN